MPVSPWSSSSSSVLSHRCRRSCSPCCPTSSPLQPPPPWPPAAPSPPPRAPSHAGGWALSRVRSPSRNHDGDWLCAGGAETGIIKRCPRGQGGGEQ